MRLILAEFAKFWKATISFVICLCVCVCVCVCLSVRPSVRMEQLGSKWKDFHEIWYLGITRKSAEKIQIY